MCLVRMVYRDFWMFFLKLPDDEYYSKCIRYRLIREQFECMAECLAWEKVFYLDDSATAADDLKNNEKAMKELIETGRKL